MSSWMSRLLRSKEKVDSTFTSDAKDLEAKGAHLVFVYDDMMRYRSEHPQIADFIFGYYGSGFTNKLVEAYISSNPEHVVAFLSQNELQPKWSDQTYGCGAYIRGDILLMGHEGLYKLDKYYNNGVYYQRIPIPCEVWKEKYRGRHNNPCREYEAWIYLGIRDKWDIDGGYRWKPLTLRRSISLFTPRSYFYNQSRSSILVT